MKVLNVVGARPNFMKIAPIHRAFLKFSDIKSLIVHTGQHHDAQMSDVFFDQLELPRPDYLLGVSGGSHTQQTAQIMLRFEEVVQVEKPDIVLVVGDVNSTLACTLVAVKEHIPVVHVEAGLRSGDRKMPEEINRILTDSVSDHLFITEPGALENLLRENIPAEKIHFVGNVMIDSLFSYREKAGENDLLNELNLAPKSYVLMTMHRPSNVDDEISLRKILQIIKQVACVKPVVFSMHPRISKNIENFDLQDEFESVSNLTTLKSQGYLEFIKLMDNAALVITDSGGIQEETTYLQIPCITLRESTERPITVEIGTNYLLPGLEAEAVVNLVNEILETGGKKGEIPELWDGNAADRIVAILREKYIN